MRWSTCSDWDTTHRLYQWACGIGKLKPPLDRVIVIIEKAGIPIDEKLIASGDYTTETAPNVPVNCFPLENPPQPSLHPMTRRPSVSISCSGIGNNDPAGFVCSGFRQHLESKYMGLTTVDQFISEMGFVATQILIKLINGEPLDSQTYRMKTRLVIRSSCLEYR